MRFLGNPRYVRHAANMSRKFLRDPYEAAAPLRSTRETRWPTLSRNGARWRPHDRVEDGPLHCHDAEHLEADHGQSKSRLLIEGDAGCALVLVEVNRFHLVESGVSEQRVERVPRPIRGSSQ